MLLGMFTAGLRTNAVYGLDRGGHLFRGIHEEPGLCVTDDLGQRATTKSDDRRATSRCFHGHQRTGLVDLAGDQHRTGITQELDLLLETWLFEELDLRAKLLQSRQDLAHEILMMILKGVNPPYHSE